MTGADDQRVPACVQLALGAEHVGERVVDQLAGGVLTMRGQAAGTQHIGAGVGAGGIDDRLRQEFPSVGEADEERHVLAARRTKPVVPQSADPGHSRAQPQPGSDGGMLRQRREVLIDQLGAGRQPLRIRRDPAFGFEQAASGGVDVVAPRTEDPHVTPLRHRGAGLRSGLHKQEVEALLGKVRRRGHADRARADHHDRRLGRAHR